MEKKAKSPLPPDPKQKDPPYIKGTAEPTLKK